MEKQMKKPSKPIHTSSAKKGSGDFYGQGVRNPVMRPRDIMGMKEPNSKMKTVPRSMA